jgi:hypothetical protein
MEYSKPVYLFFDEKSTRTGEEDHRLFESKAGEIA